MKKYVIIGAVLLVVILGCVVTVQYYTFIFAKDVAGEILKIERVNQQEMVITNGAQIPASQLYSFAVSIKDASGEIHTASTEDRQWAAAQAGQCVEAKYFPYPPWNLEKTGTFHSARLIRLFECKKP